MNDEERLAVLGELLVALLNSSGGRRSLPGDAQLLAQRVLLGRDTRARDKSSRQLFNLD